MSFRILLGAMAAVVAFATPASAASIWTEVPADRFSPPTTAAILAVEYQAADRFWFTTSDGSIYTRDGAGTFVRRHGPSAVPLNDIEFIPGSGIGIAVGNGGQVLRSTNGGQNWVAITGIPVSDNGDSTFRNCRVTEALGDVYSVRFAGAGRVWIFGPGSQVARSQPANAAEVGAAGTWIDANRDTRGTSSPDDDSCRLASTYNEGFADAFFPPSNPDVGYIVAGSFSEVFFTSNNLASAASKKPAGAGNVGSVRRNVAGDPTNPGRIWATGPGSHGRSMTAYTQDGFATSDLWKIANPGNREFPDGGAWDVDFAGGTVLAAGDAGMVLNSTDGESFYYNDADGPLATHDWRSVSLASASDGAIGGINGKLALTTQANKIPDLVAPTGSIDGPATVTAGAPATFTANATDNAGGAGIDPNGFTWTATGTPGASGRTASLTFSGPGTFTVKVVFKDLAGNAGQATRTVTVEPAVKPGFGFPAKAPAKARRKGRKVIVTVKGTLVLPAGLSATQACRGRVLLRVAKGRKKLAAPSATLGSTCAFKRTIKIARKKVGKAKSLLLTVSFTGNDAVAAGSRRYKLRIRMK